MKPLLYAVCLLAGSACELKAQLPAGARAGRTQAVEQGTFSGKVVETMNAADYTYLLVNTGSEKCWVAAPKLEVKVGDSVSVIGGMAMPDHHSKALNRDFPLVYFTGSVSVNGTRPPFGVASADTSALPKNHPAVSGASPERATSLGDIKKAKDGKLVAEILVNRAALKGQLVAVRGRVVKYNSGILGKNWFHIRDGSGGSDSNDLLVTSNAEVKIGDTVLVRGKVAVDKDFGSGYRYAVMIDEAKVVIE